MTTLIFGHQNPDTDAVTSAMSFAEYQRQLGNTDVEAVALGEMNPETQYALDYFKHATPRVVKTVANETDTVPKLGAISEKRESHHDNIDFWPPES